MLSRFHRIPERKRHTDGTDRQICYKNVLIVSCMQCFQALAMTGRDAGIVHKGDGSNVYVRSGHVMTPLLGDRDRRRLMAPVSLASAADGSVYVGDLRVIRKLTAARDSFTDVIRLKYANKVFVFVVIYRTPHTG